MLSAERGYTCSTADVQLLQSSISSHNDHAVFVAESAYGQVHGWIHVFISRRLISAPYAELGGLIVDGAEEATDIGEALLKQAENWATGAGCFKLRVRSNLERTGAGNFYQAEGYTLSQTQGVFEKTLARGGA
jgi:GNAT superfamily N-acetyltransferase